MHVVSSGDAPLTGVTARVRLPQELKFQTATAGGRLIAGEVVWKIGALRAGERRELQLTATPVTGVGLATLTGSVSADKLPAQAAETSFEVMGMPALRAEIVPPADGVATGGQGVVTVRVANEGTLAARNVTVAVVAPAPFLTPRFGGGPTVGRVHGERIEFAPVARIEPHQAVTFQVEVAGSQPGDGRIRVDLRSDSMAQVLTSEHAVRVVPPPKPGLLPTAP